MARCLVVNHYSCSVTIIDNGASDRDAAPDTGGAAADPRLQVMRWEQAEASLFALAVADTEMFELAVNASVAVRDELRGRCHTLDELIGESVRDVADRVPLLQQAQQQGLDPRTVFDAARAQRRRELSVAHQE